MERHSRNTLIVIIIFKLTASNRARGACDSPGVSVSFLSHTNFFVKHCLLFSSLFSLLLMC